MHNVVVFSLCRCLRKIKETLLPSTSEVVKLNELWVEKHW